MKNRYLFNVGDKVEILSPIGRKGHLEEDLGKLGTIKEVRASFCKIEIENKVKNYPYLRFKLIEKTPCIQSGVSPSE